MCCTLQSPRTANAFSSACAARTWPAPEEADSSNTRGLRVISNCTCSRFLRAGTSRTTHSCWLPGAGSEFFQDAASNFLRFTEAAQIFLKFMIDGFCVLNAEFMTKNHIAQFYGMRQKRIFLQLFQRGRRVIMVHRGLRVIRSKR